MKKSQNMRQVGYSMILVSASLVAVLKSFALHSLKWAVFSLDILSANNTSSPISNPTTKTGFKLVLPLNWGRRVQS